MAYTTIDKPSDYFNTVLYTGDGTNSRAVTGVGFQPDWVWIKNRDSAINHGLFDIVRGAGERLSSNLTDAEVTRTDNLTSFDSDGFTVNNGTVTNSSSTNYTSWNWLGGVTASSNTDGSITSNVSANTTSGFSIVTWTGVGSATNADTVGHGLNQKPDIYIFKNRSNSSNNWIVRTDVIDGSSDFLSIATTSAKSDSGVNYADSSVFSLGSSGADNTSGEEYVGYFFHSVKGYSKIGSYTGNGSTDGTFVYTGFRPAFVVVKYTSGDNGNWIIYDAARDAYNVAYKRLGANLSDSENQDDTNLGVSTTTGIDLVSNGFKIRTVGVNHNTSGGTYVYMAFAENPFVTSTGVPATAR